MAARRPKGAPQVRTQDETLDPVEEHVVRMRHGYRLPDDVPLGTKDGGRADVAEQLRQMELQALAESGRLEALRERAEAEEAAEATKTKIVERLKAKDQAASDTDPDAGKD
ncbi:MAG TPA: hypothetical protein RMG48_03710 [Myxococcales bacterium LLY-WYZ-16_1]|nr:hypothetical protein [Myxococcales bacterium LLY-WYZ-16_1]